MTQSDQSDTDRLVLDADRLVVAVQEAWDLSAAAARVIAERDAALDRLVSMVGGDRLSAIRTAHTRIGEITTGRIR